MENGCMEASYQPSIRKAFFRVCGPSGSGKLASFLSCPHHIAVGFIEELGRIVSAHDLKKERENLDKE